METKTTISKLLNYLMLLIASLPLFTVYIFSSDLVNGRYTAKTFYFYFVTLIIFTVIAGYFLMNKKPLRIALTKIDIALLIFCLYGFIRMVLTPNTPLLNTRFLTLTMLLGLYFFWKYLFSPAIEGSEFNPAWPARPPGAIGQSRKQPQTNEKIFLLIILLVGMGQAIYGLFQLYNILPVPPNIGGFKAFGNFGNPAPYGSFLGPFIPLALGTYLLIEPKKSDTIKDTKKNLPRNKLKKRKNTSQKLSLSTVTLWIKNSLDDGLKNVALMTFLATLLVIPATNSRSAWVSAIVGMAIILEYKYKIFSKVKKFLFEEPQVKSEKQENDNSTSSFNQTQDDKSNSRTLRPFRLSILIILLLSIILSGSIFLYNYKKDSAFGRVLQWKVTANMIKDKPVFGHGFNSYGLYYNTYQADYFASEDRSEQEKLIAGNSQQAHNDYLEVFTELGLVGFILFMSILFLIFRNYFYAYKKQKIISIIAFAGLMAYLTECLFTYPLQILPSLVIIVGLVSLSGHTEPVEVRPTKRKIFLYLNELIITRRIQKLTALILLTLIITLALTQTKNYTAHRQWHTANYYSAAQQYQVSAKLYQQLYPILKSNGSFLLNYGGTLALDEKYEKAIPLLKAAEKYVNDPNLFLNLANCYKETKEYKKAEKYYQKAEHIVPHQMYPKYLLVKLYKEMNEKEKLQDKANEILNMKIKINSTAIYEMQEEIRKLVKS